MNDAVPDDDTIHPMFFRSGSVRAFLFIVPFRDS
jgi:hypothetical protein